MRTKNQSTAECVHIPVSRVKCSTCGNSFFMRCRKEEYAYRRNDRVFCTWGCLRAYDAAHPRMARGRKAAMA